MKRDKPWRPADHPAPLLHIVQPEEPMHDPDFTDEQADKIDVILVVVLALGLAGLVLFAIIVFVNRMLTVGR